MTGRDRAKPILSEAGRREQAERERRRAAALRENLRKRKAQQRARAGERPAADGAASDEPKGD